MEKNMAKWADYIITAVGYDRNGIRILEVEIRPDTGTNIGQASRATRQQVVNAIERGVTFATAFHRDGKWHRGQGVHVVLARGAKYLRTDRNSVEADNLGSLPRLARVAS